MGTTRWSDFWMDLPALFQHAMQECWTSSLSLVQAFAGTLQVLVHRHDGKGFGRAAVIGINQLAGKLVEGFGQTAPVRRYIVLKLPCSRSPCNFNIVDSSHDSSVSRIPNRLKAVSHYNR